MAQERDIKYLGKTFPDFRNQLIEFSKNYFPDTYNDFSPTSPGMLFLEMASYVGDVLSFYQDSQLQETFLQHATLPGNLFDLAYMNGYRPKIITSAEAVVEVSQEVDALAGSFTPDYSQAIILEENSIVTSNTSNQAQFFFTNKVDFTYSSSLDPTRVEILTLSGSDPATYRLTKTARITSGEIRETVVSVGQAQKFFSITLPDSNISHIISITGSDASVWYEVPYLGQETVFSEVRNTQDDSGRVYNSLQLVKAPRRFISRYNSSGQLTIQFGAGVLPSDDENFLPSIENVGLGTNTGISRLDYAYDPSNFLYSRTYGLAPSNIDLQIKYAVPGGILDNVPANTINQFTSISNIGSSAKIDTLSVNNPAPARGGSDGDSLEEIRQNAMRSFSEQGRLVTIDDYKVRVLSLPPSLGNIAKVFIQQDQSVSANTKTDSIIDSNPLSLTLYLLGLDIDGKLTSTTSTLKDNLKKYLSEYMILTDSINLTDAFVINIGVEYEIRVLPDFTSREVLLKCNQAIANFLNTNRLDINSTINLNQLQITVSQVKGVQSIQKLNLVNKTGGNYSVYGYDLNSATRAGIVYPSLDPSIFEIKFPDQDIKGRVVI